MLDTLRKIIHEQLQTCDNVELLDLICKLLMAESG